MDAICFSDVHLGSDVCKAKLLKKFLKDIHKEENSIKYLILNGDIFDNWDFRRLKKTHWSILSRIRKLSNKIKIIWVNGNHDATAKLVAPLLGAEVVNEYVIESGLVRSGKFQSTRRYIEFLTEWAEQHPDAIRLGKEIYFYNEIALAHQRLLEHYSRIKEEEETIIELLINNLA